MAPRSTRCVSGKLISPFILSASPCQPFMVPTFAPSVIVSIITTNFIKFSYELKVCDLDFPTLDKCEIRSRRYVSPCGPTHCHSFGWRRSLGTDACNIRLASVGHFIESDKYTLSDFNIKNGFVSNVLWKENYTTISYFSNFPTWGLPFPFTRANQIFAISGTEIYKLRIQIKTFTDDES